METIADHNEWRGKANLDDGEWTTFVDPETSPDFFDHMSDVVKVKFMGESWETGPWVVPNKFPPNTRAERHAHAADTIYVIMRGSMTFNDGTGWYERGDVRWVGAAGDTGGRGLDAVSGNSHRFHGSRSGAAHRTQRRCHCVAVGTARTWVVGPHHFSGSGDPDSQFRVSR